MMKGFCSAMSVGLLMAPLFANTNQWPDRDRFLGAFLGGIGWALLAIAWRKERQ